MAPRKRQNKQTRRVINRRIKKLRPVLTRNVARQVERDFERQIKQLEERMAGLHAGQVTGPGEARLGGSDTAQPVTLPRHEHGKGYVISTPPAPPMLLPAPIYYNVRDNGVVGDAVTNDHAAIQTLIDAVVAKNQAAGGMGATIFFPSGFYRVDGKLTWPQNVSIRLQGEGKGWRRPAGPNRTRITVLYRAVGNEVAMIEVLGTGDSATTRGQFEIANMHIDGFDVAGGPLLNASRCNNVVLEHVHFRNHRGNPDWEGASVNAPAHAVLFVQLHNSTMHDVFVENCTGPGHGGMFFGTGATGPTNTVLLNGFQFESNGVPGTNVGADLILSGLHDGSGQPCTSVECVNFKFEGNVSNLAPVDAPYLHLENAHNIDMLNFEIVNHRAVPSILQETPGIFALPNLLTNWSIVHGQGTEANPYDYEVDVLGGALNMAHGFFVGDPAEKYVHVASGIRDRGFNAELVECLKPGTPFTDNSANFIDDDRSAPASLVSYP